MCIRERLRVINKAILRQSLKSKHFNLFKYYSYKICIFE